MNQSIISCYARQDHKTTDTIRSLFLKEGAALRAANRKIISKPQSN